MRPWLLLRLLSWVKRCALALESIAESQRVLAAPQQPRKAPKMGTVFTPSVEERDEAWKGRVREDWGNDA